jgi:hypothetical protein
MPCNGNQLTIGSGNYLIPSAGVTLSPLGLSTATFYYIYAHLSSGNIVLEASVTGHVTSSTTGIEVKSGDSTRTLVGGACLISGPVFIDSASQRYVLSWFNQRVKKGLSSFTQARTLQTSSGSPAYSEINSEIRVNFLVLGPPAGSGEGNTTLQWAINGTSACNTAGVGVYTTAGFDGVSPQIEMSSGSDVVSGGTGNNIPLAVSGAIALTEGSHYVTLLGCVGSNGPVATWFSNSGNGAIVYTSCQISVLG